MNRRKPSFTERRILSSNEAAAYLGRSASWLADHSGELEKAGFPKPLPLVGGYDKQAIDRWIDGLSGQHAPGDHRAAWMDAIHG